MRSMTNRFLSTMFCAGTFAFAASSASGQPSTSVAPSATAPAATLTPPQVAKFVEAERPAGAGDDGVSVDLDLTVGADGALTDAKVAVSGGEAFDAAALDAVRKFTFTPARRGDKAVPARIRYRYVFEPRAAAADTEGEGTTAGAASSTPAPRAGRLEGKVLLRSGGQPIPGAEVSLLSAEGIEVRRQQTGEDGGFRFPDVAAGSYRVHVEAPELDALDQAETVAAGELTSLTYRLDTAKPAAVAEFGAVASIEAPAREVTKRTLKAEELTRSAGTRGDALRAIELLPGVAKPPGLDGLVIIRGSAPTDSQVMFEGAPVDRLYHFGGLTSFAHSRLLERIDLYPGNFSARYGRKMGGIVDVGVRDPRTDGYHGIADVNVIDSSLLVEGPVGKRGAFAVAAKRSYIDVWFQNLLPKDIVKLTAAPVYYDYQAIYTYRPENGDRLRLMGYGSGDVFRLNLANPADGDPAFSGNVGQSTSFHRLQAGWRHVYAPGVEHDITLTGGVFANNLGIGALGMDLQGRDAYGRAEWRAQVASRLRLMGGIDVHAVDVDVIYHGPSLTQFEGNPDQQGPLTAQTIATFNGKFRTFRPAAYLEALVQPWEPLTIVVGARGDYYTDVSAWSVDPRLTSRLQVARRTFIKGGVGSFTQPPDYGEALAGIGNPDLKLRHSEHYGLGVEQGFGERINLSVEGFYKNLHELQVNGTNAAGEPSVVNAGKGRIYGLEVHTKVQPTGRLFGFVSYTLSRSERNDHGEGWRLFDYDQTHILTVASGYRLGRGWDVGGTFRMVSGNPGTPVVGSIYDANRDYYAPVYGATNSIRDPLFHRLDVRVEKSWKFQAWKLATYLDLQNAYNRRSQEGLQYSYDYSKRAKIEGLPIIPSLGLRGEF
ncbi:MAG: TonB-dependent receptor [Haliangium ochraceum]